jgi:diguanylate cyclase (GGDEF)-like protein
MKKESDTKIEKPGKKILLAGMLAAIFFWFFDATVDAFIFKEGGLVDIILAPDTNNVWTRLTIMGLIIGLSAYSRKHIVELEQMKVKLEGLAATDTLTQAYNRAKYEEIIAIEMERARRFDHPLSMLMFDIDGFKKINDTFGHAVGDYVLKNIADIVRRHSRKINHLIRWGGDEFIIVPIETNLEGAGVLSERLRNAIESFGFDKAGKITVSFGAAQFENDDTEDTFLKRVDDALYKAKTNGGNRIERSV